MQPFMPPLPGFIFLFFISDPRFRAFVAVPRATIYRPSPGLNVSATCVANKVNQKFGLRLTVKNG